MNHEAKRAKRWCICLALAGSIAFAPPALAWGPEGHEVVALIAMRHLTPAATADAKRLLAVEGAPDIAAVASWADEYRRAHPETGSWHYVDIPLDAAGYEAARDCPASACVVAKIPEFAAELADCSLPDAEREVALKWVVHLVGDVHQPLHDEDDRDRGGNDVRVTWAGRATNLHHVWDSDLVRAAGRNPEELAEQLDSGPPTIATATRRRTGRTRRTHLRGAPIGYRRTTGWTGAAVLPGERPRW